MALSADRFRRAAARIVLLAVALFGAMAPCAAAALSDLTLEVRRVEGGALPGAIVMLHPLDHAVPPPAPVHAVMDQINRAFVPDVLVVPVGSSVAFPNTDTTRHQVYSFSPAHRFELPLYSGKPYPPEVFDRVGVVTLGCNIHDAMLAYILVTDAPYRGTTDASGRLLVRGVPRGRYRLELWHPRMSDPTVTLVRELTVPDDDSFAFTVSLEKPLRPKALERQPHSWDAY